MVSIRRKRNSSTCSNVLFQTRCCVWGLLAVGILLLLLLSNTENDMYNEYSSSAPATNIRNDIATNQGDDTITTITMNQTKDLSSSSSSSSCPSTETDDDVCSNTTQDKIQIQMVAMPHTASSSTNTLFAGGKHRMYMRANKWNNTMERFTCPRNTTIEMSCPQATNCILQRLSYNSKQHSTYNRLIASNKNKILFTVLRDPDQFVVSQYRERKTWDKQWNAFYNVSLINVTVEEWVEKAWWRHNLFTKMLATDTKIIWAASSYNTQTKVIPNKTESDFENSQRQNSIWFLKAWQRVETMPVFGLHHKLDNYFDLLSYTFCIPNDDKIKDRNRAPYPVSTELTRLVETYFGLDLILFHKAEKLFDQMVANMNADKDRGVLCNLNRILKRSATQEPVGLVCTNNV